MYLEDHDLDEVYYEDASPRPSDAKVQAVQYQSYTSAKSSSSTSVYSTSSSHRGQHVPSSGSGLRGGGGSESIGWGVDSPTDESGRPKRPRSLPIHNFNNPKTKTNSPKRPIFRFDDLLLGDDIDGGGFQAASSDVGLGLALDGNPSSTLLSLYETGEAAGTNNSSSSSSYSISNNISNNYSSNYSNNITNSNNNNNDNNNGSNNNNDNNMSNSNSFTGNYRSACELDPATNGSFISDTFPASSHPSRLSMGGPQSQSQQPSVFFLPDNRNPNNCHPNSSNRFSTGSTSGTGGGKGGVRGGGPGKGGLRSKIDLINDRPAHWVNEGRGGGKPTAAAVIRKPLNIANANSNTTSNMGSESYLSNTSNSNSYNSSSINIRARNSDRNTIDDPSQYGLAKSANRSRNLTQSSSGNNSNGSRPVAAANISFKPSWIKQSLRSQSSETSRKIQEEDAIEEDNEKRFDTRPLDSFAGTYDASLGGINSYDGQSRGSNRNRNSMNISSNFSNAEGLMASRVPSFRSISDTDDNKGHYDAMMHSSNSHDNQHVDFEPQEDATIVGAPLRSRSPGGLIGHGSAYTSSSLPPTTASALKAASPGHGPPAASFYDSSNSNNNNANSSSYNSKAALMASPGMKKAASGGLREKFIKGKRNINLNITKLQTGQAGSLYDLSDPRNRAEYWVSVKVDADAVKLLHGRISQGPGHEPFNPNSLNIDPSFIYVPAIVQEVHYKMARQGSSFGPGSGLSPPDSSDVDNNNGSRDERLKDSTVVMMQDDKPERSVLPLFKRFHAGDPILVCFRECDLRDLGLAGYILHLKSLESCWKTIGIIDGSDNSLSSGVSHSKFSNWKLYQPTQLAVYPREPDNASQHKTLHVVLTSLYEVISE